MFSIAPPPPKAEKPSCSELTAPVEVPVVEFAKSADPGMPKRTSLPSMLAPANDGLVASAVQITASMTPHRPAMTASRETPWRIEPTIRPKVRVSATGITRSRKISRMFESGFGFSKGCAELALKMPPPLVPSSLIDSWEAVGASAMVDGRPSGPMTSTPARRLITTPMATRATAATAAIGSRIRVQPRTMSTHALPSRSVRLRTKPRTRATATAMPTAADTKFWTVSPAIWTVWPMVVSGT